MRGFGPGCVVDSAVDVVDVPLAANPDRIGCLVALALRQRSGRGKLKSRSPGGRRLSLLRVLLGVAFRDGSRFGVYERADTRLQRAYSGIYGMFHLTFQGLQPFCGKGAIFLFRIDCLL